jgi:hypothetical protein
MIELKSPNACSDPYRPFNDLCSGLKEHESKNYLSKIPELHGSGHGNRVDKHGDG